MQTSLLQSISVCDLVPAQVAHRQIIRAPCAEAAAPACRQHWSQGGNTTGWIEICWKNFYLSLSTGLGLLDRVLFGMGWIILCFLLLFIHNLSHRTDHHHRWLNFTLETPSWTEYKEEQCPYRSRWRTINHLGQSPEIPSEGKNQTPGKYCMLLHWSDLIGDEERQY